MAIPDPKAAPTGLGAGHHAKAHRQRIISAFQSAFLCRRPGGRQCRLPRGGRVAPYRHNL